MTVPKRDGQVRICGDYKVTVNPVLNINQYPLPRPEDLFATVAGGKYFSALDLSHAYNQIVLDDDAREFLTINTHRGLFRHTRLPFGVASGTLSVPKDHGYYPPRHGRRDLLSRRHTGLRQNRSRAPGQLA